MVDKIKNRQIIGAICTLIVSSCLLSAPMAQADPFQRTASGWRNRTDVDLDMDGNTLTVLDTSGVGTFGKSTSNQVSETGAFTGTCASSSSSNLILRFLILSRSSIIRFESGDLLFSVLDTSDPPINFLCFEPSSRTSTGETHMVITGGTGKFAGATGTLLISQNSAIVLPQVSVPAIHVAVTQVTTGDIVLIH